MRGTQLYFCRSLWFEKSEDLTIEKEHTLFLFWCHLSYQANLSLKNLYSKEAGLHVCIFSFLLQTRVHTLSVHQRFEGVRKSSCLHFLLYLQAAPSIYTKTLQQQQSRSSLLLKNISPQPVSCRCTIFTNSQSKLPTQSLLCSTTWQADWQPASPHSTKPEITDQSLYGQHAVYSQSSPYRMQFCSVLLQSSRKIDNVWNSYDRVGL